jgi:hypothetical protein
MKVKSVNIFEHIVGTIGSEKILSMQDCWAGVFYLSSYSHWIWDTFAEPNNYKQYRVKLLTKIRPHSFRFIGKTLAQKAG